MEAWDAEKRALEREVSRLRARVDDLERGRPIGAGPRDPLVDALEQAPLGAVLASRLLRGEILYVNREFTAITGYTLEDVPDIGSWVLRAYPDEVYRTQVVANWNEDTDPGKMRRDIVYRVTCKDGAVKDILLRAGPVGDDRMIVTLLDISARLAAERALVESEERYRRLFEHSPLGVIVHSGGRADMVNQAAANILGCDDPADLLGEALMAYIHPDSKEEVARRVEAVYATWAASPVDRFKLLRRDGQVVHCEMSGGSTNFAGRPASQVVFSDVSDRVRLEEERARLLERTHHAQKLESLGVLAGGIAHDFNNLLVGVLGNADLALLDAGALPNVEQRLKGIVVAARRASDLVKQLLAYAGQAPVAHRPLDLAELVREMSSLLSVGLARKGTLTIEQGTDVPLIEADPTQLRQVVMNLITNAAESLGVRGGRIVVSLRAQPSTPELLDGAIGEVDPEVGELVVLEVADSGNGMDEETRARIFEPFYSTKFTGRGLGLAAVLGIVRSHGGAIRVESTPGVGTRMICLFPARGTTRRAGAASPDPTGAPSFRGQGLVLLVDDEEPVRETSRQMLEHFGFDVVVASNGLEALEQVERHRGELRCLILDLSMPVMDGAETLARLRELEPSLPVLLTSGYGEREAAAAASSDRCSTFLQKPYRISGLVRALGELLEPRG